MKKFVFVMAFLVSGLLFAQESLKHTVADGETVSKIAQKYKVTPFDIYKLNPDAQSGIKPGMILVIPKSSVPITPSTPVVDKPKTDTQPLPEKDKTTPKLAETPKPNDDSKGKGYKIHTVKQGETLYALSKKYNISVEELLQNNPVLSEKGLQPDMELIIAKGKQPVTVTNPVKTAGNKVITHIVQPKETKYGIANKYGISVEELERQNPEVKENLPIGFELKIKPQASEDKPKETPIKQQSKPTESVNTGAIQQEKPTTQEPTKVTIASVDKPLMEYTVKSGETLYSLSRLFEISQEQLTQLNPELVNGLKEGMVLKVPTNLTPVSSSGSATKSMLPKNLLTTERKSLVLLIPFNIAKIESDSLTPIAAKLKDDKFLNMTLDFYAGALMAIDSAKTLGINVDVSVFDSEETKTTTTALTTLSEKGITPDVVIGPFYQANVEKVAQELEPKKIPVISPLSKEVTKNYTNLYNSMTDLSLQRRAVFDYMAQKDGNIIAVIEPDKTEISQFIKSYSSRTKWVGLSAKGTFTADSIRKYFVKDRVNYVVLETTKYNTAQTTITSMLTAMKEYKVQLVITEHNDLLDFEEIALANLVKLKLTYPSLTRENESPEAQKFERVFRRKNKIVPNQFATRGFDLVFDTLLRLSQGKTFEQTAAEFTSEQVENKFDYKQNSAGGYNNKGVYILTYQPDLTVKEAN